MMNSWTPIRIGKIVIGGIGTFYVLSGTLTGAINLAPWHLFESGMRPVGIGLLYAVVFAFPFFLMSGIIPQGEAVMSTDSDEGVMGSYGTQSAVAERYRRHMISIVFGVMVTGVAVFVSR